LPLSFHLVEKSKIESVGIFEVEKQVTGDHEGHAVRLCQLLEPGGEIHVVGDHRPLHEALMADDAEHHGTAVDPDPTPMGSYPKLARCRL